jgi:hypothetical protein
MESKNRNLSWIFSLLIFVATAFPYQVSSQQPPDGGAERSVAYTDEELVDFIKVAQKVMPLQHESQMKMISEIEEQQLTLERFNEILEAHSIGETVEVPEEELEAFHNALENIQLVQEQYTEIISEVIVVEGMAPETYEEIIFNYQQDPELQMRINQLLDELGEPEYGEPEQ